MKLSLHEGTGRVRGRRMRRSAPAPAEGIMPSANVWPRRFLPWTRISRVIRPCSKLAWARHVGTWAGNVKGSEKFLFIDQGLIVFRYLSIDDKSAVDYW